MVRFTYRPDIDGLRALAVLPVVFFHTQLRFPGGFVGVDVFFVISGFLITGLISHEMEAGRFSLAAFWERRIRRIVPAATVMVVASLIAGYALLLPSDFNELGRSAVAEVLAVANFFFYAHSDYFATGANSKPLLHAWSLAVEEQFYLLFPFLLLMLRSLRPKLTVPVVGAIVAASFLISAVGAWQFPSATFYLLPTRAWELGLGALLALNNGSLPLPDKAKPAAGWLGLALIALPMLTYHDRLPFPGLAALPPCLGTLLIIWGTGERDGVLKRWLSLKPVVGIGLISYSLYLWHWPVMVYSHYWYTGIHSPLAMRLGVVAASFALAWLSWRYVERPFRVGRSQWRSRPVLIGTLGMSALILFGGLAISRQAGLPNRFPPQVARYDDAYDDRPDAEEADLTLEAAEAGELPSLTTTHTASGPSLLLWGDSHARAVSPALEAMCQELGVNGFRASRSETASILDWNTPEKQQYNAAVFRWIKANRPTWVVLASRWEKVLMKPEDAESLQRTIEALQKEGVSVALMRQVASQRRDIPKALALATLNHDDVSDVGVKVTDHAQFTARSNEFLDQIQQNTPGLRVLDPIPYLSRDGRCLAEDSGRALYYDYQHLTRFGAHFLTPMFETLIEQGAGSEHRQVSKQIMAPSSIPRAGFAPRHKTQSVQPWIRSERLWYWSAC